MSISSDCNVQTLTTSPIGASTAPDPFDPEALRMSQDFGVELGVQKVLLTVPVRKPDKAWFVRVHPAKEYELTTYVIELKEEGETYLVARTLWSELAGESTFSLRILYTAINRQGVQFIWAIRLPGSDGKLDGWNQSALEAAQLAKEKWVRVQPNLSLGAYEVDEAKANLPEPKWPNKSLNELLKVGFKGRYIDSLDHPVLKKLRGEV